MNSRKRLGLRNLCSDKAQFKTIIISNSVKIWCAVNLLRQGAKIDPKKNNIHDLHIAVKALHISYACTNNAKHKHFKSTLRLLHTNYSPESELQK